MSEKLKNRLVHSFIVAASSLFSGFMYLNIYEAVTLSDLPHVPAVQTTNHPKVIATAYPGNLKENETIGFYGKPNVIRVPKLGFVSNLKDSKKNVNGWILDNDSIAYYPFSKSNAGVIGDTLIFGLESAKITDFTMLTNEGDRVVIETDLGWRYNFKITSKQVVPDDGTYLPSESPTGRLYLLDQLEDGNNLIVECQFASVEETK